jgi:adenylate cyclase
MSGAELRQRLVAILAADVAGYSRLMSVDERATVTALDTTRAVFRSRIESNHGRVIDMAGDSVLAVFETATGAVSAALAIQQQLSNLFPDLPDDQRMRFRIGVHLGDVIEKSDGTVYGDGVNIAARLQGLAEPGGITVSESIRTAVRSKVSAQYLVHLQGAQRRREEGRA